VPQHGGPSKLQHLRWVYPLKNEAKAKNLRPMR
jgi:hypothetical protein